MKVKIIGFNRFDDGCVCDCLAQTEKGKHITVDPFVGCAVKLKDAEKLLGNSYDIEGYWFDGVFLVNEHGLKLLSSK